MNQRFRNEEAEAIRSANSNCRLWQAVNLIGCFLETDMPTFAMRPEEMYCETIDLLDRIASNAEDYVMEIDSDWHRIYNSYRRFDPTVPADELNMAVAIVFGFAVIALGSSSHHLYSHTLPEAIITCIVSRHGFTSLHKTMEKILQKADEIPDGWFDGFVENHDAHDTAAQANVKADTTKKQEQGTVINIESAVINCKREELDNSLNFDRLPPKLASPRAKELWTELFKAGFVDSNCISTRSRTESAIMAKRMAELLGLKQYWQAFSTLWNMTNLKNASSKALDYTSSWEFEKKLKQIIG